MLILLTNDDGISSEGLMILRNHLSKEHEVFVVAPERERTCVGHAVTIHKPLRIEHIEDNVFSSNGTPVDCVLLAIKVLLPNKPDLVISGINRGPNMGQDVNYSGTVAAAKEGAFLGVPSMAISLNARKEFLFHDAAEIAGTIIGILSEGPPSPSTCLNINIPNVPQGKIRGFMVTRLGKRVYNDNIIERTDPRGRKYYWIGGDGEKYEMINGTDFCAVERGYISVTPLDLDGTSMSSMRNYRRSFRRRKL